MMEETSVNIWNICKNLPRAQFLFACLVISKQDAQTFALKSIC